MNLEEGVNFATLLNPIHGDAGIRPEDKNKWINISATIFDISPEGLTVSFKDEAHTLTLFPKDYKEWYKLLGNQHS